MSLAQLLDLGLTRAAVEGRVRRKRLFVVHRGVYAVGHRGLTHHSQLIAAVYACGPGALLSHRSAGALHGLVRGAPARVAVTVPAKRRGKDGVTVYRSRAIPPEDRTVVAAVPVTTIARTLVDLADLLSEERLAKAVHQAEVLRVFDLAQLEQALARVPGRRGRHRLRRALAAHGIQSVRVTWPDLGAGLMRQVREILRQR